jgi:hypothetical protein
MDAEKAEPGARSPGARIEADGVPDLMNITSPGGARDNHNAWTRQAAELAAWTWERLVIRTDVWGGYCPLSERGKTYTTAAGEVKTVPTSWTKPRIKDRGKILLTPDILARHFRGQAAENLVGLHSTSPENTSRWGALDIDRHDGGEADPEKNLRFALACYARLVNLGFSPLLTGSNGKGGYHLRALLDQPADTGLVYNFLRWLVSDYALFGLDAPPETFPKQPKIEEGRYGNWIRLPGRHHTKGYWSEVWDGTSWLEGDAAALHILGLRGTSPDRFPPCATTPLAPPPSPGQKQYRNHAKGSLSDQIAAYMGRLPHRSAGQGRTDVAYNFAAFLVRDLALDTATALNWLDKWDQGNRPALGRDRLSEIMRCASAYGRRAIGSGLLADPPVRIVPTKRAGHQILRCRLEVY